MVGLRHAEPEDPARSEKSPLADFHAGAACYGQWSLQAIHPPPGLKAAMADLFDSALDRKLNGLSIRERVSAKRLLLDVFADMKLPPPVAGEPFAVYLAMAIGRAFYELFRRIEARQERAESERMRKAFVNRLSVGTEDRQILVMTARAGLDALHRTHPQRAACLAYKYLVGYSLADIEARTGLSSQNIRTHLKHGAAFMRRYLSAEGKPA